MVETRAFVSNSFTSFSKKSSQPRSHYILKWKLRKAIEEFEILPSISGYPFIQYPKFPEDNIEELKTNEASYERQLSWALKETTEMVANK
ncbi:hypothetical protein NPIL_84831 [Nephila pilipes]|uniref:Uncharacterized protein n=1 Tax=Nephila pilipes TaxID=299642 RepID=A0A8X6TYC4_NEPPI|nr:hypothetical protein NPIL_84831 [Nephila pilipes]